MKRIVLLLLTAVLLCACAGTSATEAPAANAPVESGSSQGTPFAQRVAAAWEAAGLLESLAPYSEEDFLDLYGIVLTECIGGAGYADAVGYTDEAVVVEADEAKAAEIETLLRNHVEAMKEQFQSYDAEAYALAEHAVLQRDGGVVLMIISPDAEEMLKVFRSVSR